MQAVAAAGLTAAAVAAVSPSGPPAPSASIPIHFRPAAPGNGCGSEPSCLNVVRLPAPLRSRWIVHIDYAAQVKPVANCIANFALMKPTVKLLTRHAVVAEIAV